MWIPDKDANGNIVIANTAFKSKAVSGGKLFRRKKGFIFPEAPANGSSFIELVAPYTIQKINEIEIVNANSGDQLDMLVLDSVSGLYQQSLGVPPGNVTPKMPLNQFGFLVNLPDGFYKDVSQYDAELVGSMIIKLIYYNNSSSALTPLGNIIWHEVVSI